MIDNYEWPKNAGRNFIVAVVAAIIIFTLSYVFL